MRLGAGVRVEGLQGAVGVHAHGDVGQGVDGGAQLRAGVAEGAVDGVDDDTGAVDVPVRDDLGFRAHEVGVFGEDGDHGSILPIGCRAVRRAGR